MKSKISSLIAAIALFCAIMALPIRVDAQEQIRYTVKDLGTLGGTFGRAWGINNKGSVVGFATLPGDTTLHAFLWRNGAMKDLGSLAGADPLPSSAAFSVNDDNEVVGFSEISAPDPQNTCGNSLVCLPVLWREGTINPLPTLGGIDGQASSINNRGQVVGIAETDKTDPRCGTPVFKPVIWVNGQVRALPTDPFLDGVVGGAFGPAGNNDKGQVVGQANTCDFSSIRDLIWDKHRVIDMGTLEGLSFAPIAINIEQQATGTYTTTLGINRAFIWDDGVATDLGTLPGDNFAEGGAINDRGQIVGQSCSDTSCSVFLWQNGAMTDLNVLVPANSSLFLIAATGINFRGQIAGWAIQKSTGQFRAFLASPCREDEDDWEGCRNGAKGRRLEQFGARERPALILPDNLRKMVWHLRYRHDMPGLSSLPK
jgi:probable HAF family extracellular repeat protein